MKFIKTKSFNIQVLKEQENQLSKKEKIQKVIEFENVIAFDILHENILIGFAMLQEFEKSKFFLWNYAIDYKYQNQDLGKKALIELIGFLRENYDCQIITTTYKFGNDHAKHLYESLGFIQTDVVYEGDIHEVNMQLELQA